MTFSEIVSRLARMCLEINPEPTKRDTTGEKPTVFIDFSGHTCALYISIFPNGWSENAPYEKYVIRNDCTAYAITETGGDFDFSYLPAEHIIDKLKAIEEEWT